MFEQKMKRAFSMEDVRFFMFVAVSGFRFA